MKLQYIKASFLLVLGFSMVLTGCLKDKDFDNGLIQSGQGGNTKVISLGVNTASSVNFATLSYATSNTDTVVDFLPVWLNNGNSPAPQDLHVTIAQADTVVTNYNTAHKTNYVVPSSVSIVNAVVTIPRGSYMAYLQVKFVPSTLVGQKAALGFAIASVQETGYVISGNFNTGVIAISVK
jgi:hypothetical protein